MASLFERALPLVEPLKPGQAPQRGTELYILSVVMVVVAGLFVAARISVRVSKLTTSQGLGNDDYCVLAALISSVGLSLTEIEATVYGYGNHLDSLTKTQIHEALEFYVAQIMYKVVITFNKMALLLFYLRVFPQQKFRLLCFAGLTFVGCSGLAYIIATIFQCSPVPYYWNRTILGGHCIESAPFWISYAVINICTDFYILCLPMPILYSLSLSKKNKYGVMGCFALGFFVCFTTIYRMTTLASSSKGTDLTFGPVPATNWSVIEANTGLICTCLPMLNQYIKVFFGFFGRTPANTSSIRPGNTPRSGKFSIGRYNLSTKNDKDEIFGTGRQWGAVDSTVESRGDMMRTESQENMVGDKQIHRTVDVEMWRTDGRSDESLKI
ncbi:hypothetical protein V8E51_017804 [Hyaloscypha variabilis]